MEGCSGITSIGGSSFTGSGVGGSSSSLSSLGGGLGVGSGESSSDLNESSDNSLGSPQS